MNVSRRHQLIIVPEHIICIQHAGYFYYVNIIILNSNKCNRNYLVNLFQTNFYLHFLMHVESVYKFYSFN